MKSEVPRYLFDTLESLVGSAIDDQNEIDHERKEFIKYARINGEGFEVPEIQDSYMQKMKEVRRDYNRALVDTINAEKEAGRIDRQSKTSLINASISRLNNPEEKTIEQLFMQNQESNPETYVQNQESNPETYRKIKETANKLGQIKRPSEIKKHVEDLFKRMAEAGGVTGIYVARSENKIKLKNNDFIVNVPLKETLEGKPRGSTYQLLQFILAYAMNQTNLKSEEGLTKDFSLNNVNLHLDANYSTKHHPNAIRRDINNFRNKHDIPVINCGYA